MNKAAMPGFRREWGVREPTPVLLGQPSRYPAAMVAAVRAVLARHPNVRAAYLALAHAPSMDAEPHLLIGIEADGDIEAVMQEAGTVAGAPRGEAGEFGLMQVVAGGPGVSASVVRSRAPFYVRGGRTVC